MKTIEIGKSQGASAHGYHKLSSYLRCPREYLLAEVRKLTVPQEYTPAPLAIGLMLHAMRATWFAERFDMGRDTWNKILNSSKEAAEQCSAPVTAVDQDAALNLFAAYIDKYKDQAKKPEPLACEYLLEYNVNGLPFTARLDEVSYYGEEAGGKLCIGECKSTSDFGACIRQYEFNPQVLLQQALWKYSEDGEAKHGPVAGTILDMLRKPQGTPGQKGYRKPAFMRVLIPYDEARVEMCMDMMINAKAKAQSLTWDSVPQPNLTSCVRPVGRAIIDCAFKPLCSGGRTALGMYEIDGRNATEWEPEYEGQAEPHE